MNYKVEIVTATTAGLKKLMRDIQRVRDERPKPNEELAGRRQSARHHGRVKSRMAGGRNVPIVLTAKNGSTSLTLDGGDPGPAAYIGPLNREVNMSRVDDYRVAMMRGEWWFTPDPVVVTNEGDIINGQHRLLAAWKFAADKEPEHVVPQFVVVWGVDKRAALLIDEARRTGTDRRDIALRFAASSSR
jgi:hypothetical protein